MNMTTKKKKHQGKSTKTTRFDLLVVFLLSCIVLSFTLHLLRRRTHLAAAVLAQRFSRLNECTSPNPMMLGKNPSPALTHVPCIHVFIRFQIIKSISSFALPYPLYVLTHSAGSALIL